MKKTRTEEPVVELPVPQPDDADVVITDDFDHEVCSEPVFHSSSSDEDEENEDEDEEQSLSAEPEIVKCGFWRKLPLLPLLWHANAVDEN